MPYVAPKVAVIYVLRNGDMHSEPRKFVINLQYYRNLPQLYNFISNKVNVTSAVRNLYTPTGRRVTGLDDIISKSFYIATSGEKFKEKNYRLEVPVTAPASRAGSRGGPPSVRNSSIFSTLRMQSKDPLTNRRLVSRKGNVSYLTRAGISAQLAERKKSQDPIVFTQKTKAYRVVIFPNGDEKHFGVVMHLSHRNARSFSQMLSEISKTMKDSTSFVRVLYDAETGNRVNSLTQLYDGINLVAASRLREPFKNVNYHLVSKEKFEEAHHKTKPSHPNQYYHDPDPEKFDTEEQPKVITVFPNGDAEHKGVNITCTKVRFPTFDKLMDHVNKHIDLRTAIGRKLFRISDGALIKSMAKVESGEKYAVAAAIDPFMNVEYNSMAWVPLDTLLHVEPKKRIAKKKKTIVKKRAPVIMQSTRRLGAKSGNNLNKSIQLEVIKPEGDAMQSLEEFDIKPKKPPTDKISYRFEHGREEVTESTQKSEPKPWQRLPKAKRQVKKPAVNKVKYHGQQEGDLGVKASIEEAIAELQASNNDSLYADPQVTDLPKDDEVEEDDVDANEAIALAAKAVDQMNNLVNAVEELGDEAGSSNAIEANGSKEADSYKDLNDASNLPESNSRGSSHHTLKSKSNLSKHLVESKSSILSAVSRKGDERKSTASIAAKSSGRLEETHVEESVPVVDEDEYAFSDDDMDDDGIESTNKPVDDSVIISNQGEQTEQESSNVDDDYDADQLEQAPSQLLSAQHIASTSILSQAKSSRSIAKSKVIKSTHSIASKKSARSQLPQDGSKHSIADSVKNQEEPSLASLNKSQVLAGQSTEPEDANVANDFLANFEETMQNISDFEDSIQVPPVTTEAPPLPLDSSRENMVSENAPSRSILSIQHSNVSVGQEGGPSQSHLSVHSRTSMREEPSQSKLSIHSNASAKEPADAEDKQSIHASGDYLTKIESSKELSTADLAAQDDNPQEAPSGDDSQEAEEVAIEQARNNDEEVDTLQGQYDGGHDDDQGQEETLEKTNALDTDEKLHETPSSVPDAIESTDNDLNESKDETGQADSDIAHEEDMPETPNQPEDEELPIEHDSKDPSIAEQEEFKEEQQPEDSGSVHTSSADLDVGDTTIDQGISVDPTPEPLTDEIVAEANETAEDQET